jgi:glycosyltransferase involved in cell wall biosynthesis
MLRQGDYDAVISTELFQVGTGISWMATKGSGTKAFVWQELDVLMRGPAGSAQHWYYRTLGRQVARGMARIIPRSRSARAHLLGEGIPPEQVATTVVHSGVDTELFRPMDKEPSRAKHGLEGAESVILCLGRLHSNKGMDIMIRAMPGLLRERKGTVLVIKGRGPQEEELKRMVKKMGLERSVLFLAGHVPKQEMPSLFNSADVLAVTSRIDLFPFTAIESISCGTPVATSFARGLKTDMVDEGAAALLPADEEKLPVELAALLADEGRLRQMGRRGRELAESDFDFSVGASRLIRIFSGEAA